MSTRRTWSKFEEAQLLNVLDEFVAGGHRYETGSFKSGTLTQMEKSLNILCHYVDTGAEYIKASPHIESKLKKFKQKYKIVFDMINTSGFAWNDQMQCVEVDSDDAWNTYVQYHKEAKDWRNKPFPEYERLANIFGNDHVNGKGAEVLSEMMEEQSNNEANETENGADNDDSPMSVNKESNQSVGNQSVQNQSVSSKGKRKRAVGSSDDDKLITALRKMFELNGKRMQMMIDAIIKGTEDRSDIAKELKKMGLSPMNQIAALTKILDKPQTISLFKSCDADLKKVFVAQLLGLNDLDMA